MVKFVYESSADTINRLSDWMKKDPYHKDNKLQDWYLSDGYFLTAAWIYDNDGPVMYFRLDIEGEYIRLNTQFAPEELVSRKRQALPIIQAFPEIVDLITNIPEAKGIIFWSISSDLIRFMKRLGFEEWKENEFIYKFQMEQLCAVEQVNNKKC